MTNHLHSESQSKGSIIQASESNRSDKESLLNRMAELHLAFSEHRALDMSNLFSEDAILMFPGTQDIISRESIHDAFVDFMTIYTTLSFEVKQEYIDIGDQRATLLAKFIEVRTPYKGGPKEKVYGRILEIWELSSEGKWEAIRMMTGRYAETELFE